MASVAYDGELSFAPFWRMYELGEGALLANSVFAVTHRRGDPEPDERAEAVTPKVIAMPNRAAFRESVAQWIDDIRFDSFPDEMKEHESFHRIVAQGFGVVPLIAAHLRRRPSFLFLALEEIFGEDPVPEDAYGNLTTVSAAWLEWLQR